MKRKIWTILMIMLGLDSLAQSTDKRPPVMGWSSWNTYHVDISDSLIRRQAEAMVEKGLKSAGYTYINVDDGYFGGRNSEGRLLVHPTRFPHGMKPVADYIHSLGLKAGLYSEAGCVTCGSIYDNDSLGIGSGMYGHEDDDARLFFHDWGYDFIKIDYCGAKRQKLDEQEQYTRICQAIRKAAAGREVSVNLCRWAFPGTWAADIARSWRISTDIRPKWSSIKNIIEKNLYLSAYCHDGHYNDMDMLEIGRGLKPYEEETHFAIWCIMSSPLLIGCDLTKIPEQSLRLITNPELIALNQDPLHLQAYVVQHEDDGYVLIKDVEQLRGQTRAVAFYNSGDSVCHFSIPLSALELQGPAQVRNLLSRTDEPQVSDHIACTVPPHATYIYKVTGRHRLMPTMYEAEWAFLPGYADLENRKFPIVYQAHEHASGRMMVAHVGGSHDNRLIFHHIYSERAGKRRLTIHYLPAETGPLVVTVNGKEYAINKLRKQGGIAKVSVKVMLQPGYNTIELGNDRQQTVDIDKIEL